MWLADNDQLKLLETFDERERWVLEPGDMLYLPPNIAHWGTAVDECLTYSIGFRAPTVAEILGDLAIELTLSNDDRYYRDPPLTPEMATGDIDDAFVRQIQSLLKEVIDEDDIIRDWTIVDIDVICKIPKLIHAGFAPHPFKHYLAIVFVILYQHSKSRSRPAALPPAKSKLRHNPIHQHCFHSQLATRIATCALARKGMGASMKTPKGGLKMCATNCASSRGTTSSKCAGGCGH